MQYNNIKVNIIENIPNEPGNWSRDQNQINIYKNIKKPPNENKIFKNNKKDVEDDYQIGHIQSLNSSIARSFMERTLINYIKKIDPGISANDVSINNYEKLYEKLMNNSESDPNLIRHLKTILENLEQLISFTQLFKKNDPVMSNIFKSFRNKDLNLCRIHKIIHEPFDSFQMSFDITNLKFNEKGYTYLQPIFRADADKKLINKYKAFQFKIHRKSIPSIELHFYAFKCRMKNMGYEIIDNKKKIHKFNKHSFINFLINGEIFKNFNEFKKIYIEYKGNSIYYKKNLHKEFIIESVFNNDLSSIQVGKIFTNCPEKIYNKLIPKTLCKIIYNFKTKKNKWVQSKWDNYYEKELRELWIKNNYPPDRFTQCSLTAAWKELSIELNIIYPYKNGKKVIDNLKNCIFINYNKILSIQGNIISLNKITGPPDLNKVSRIFSDIQRTLSEDGVELLQEMLVNLI